MQKHKNKAKEQKLNAWFQNHNTFPEATWMEEREWDFNQ